MPQLALSPTGTPASPFRVRHANHKSRRWKASRAGPFYGAPRGARLVARGSCQRDRRPDPQYPNRFPAFWRHLARRRPGADDFRIVGTSVSLIFMAALPRNAEASVNLGISVPVHWPAVPAPASLVRTTGWESRGAAIPRHASRTALERRGEESRPIGLLPIASHESVAVDCCGLWRWTLQRCSVHPQHIPDGLGMCYRHRERCSSCQRLPVQKEARSRRFYWSNASGIEPANSPSSAVLNLARNSTPGSKPNSNPSDSPARTRRRSI